ncbi:MAG: PAS domain S-box protein [Bacteroidales bacterium]
MKNKSGEDDLEKMLRERTEALQNELADRRKAEENLIKTLDRLKKKRAIIFNLMQDLKLEIEERKKIEKKLEEERNLLLTIIDNIPDPINLKDSEGKYILNNKAHLNLIGASSREEAKMKTSYNFFTNENAAEFTRNEKLVLTSGKMLKDIEEHLLHKKSNKWHWHLTSKIPVHDENGMLTRILTISHDITERKNLENKLRESENFFRSLIEISPDGIAIFNPEGVLIYASKKAYELFHLYKELALNKFNLLDFIDPSFHSHAMENFAEIICGKTIQETKEYLLRRLDGSSFWGEISFGGLKDLIGEITAIITIWRDVTERKMVFNELVKAKEKAQESDRLKEAFIRNISHEIRTPANVISGFSELMRKHSVDQEELNYYASVIISSTNQLTNIINNIIELSNIEAGLVKLKESEFNVNSTLSRLYSEFSGSAEEKGLSFRYETALSGDEAIIKADEAKIEKILKLLLSNAIKFTHKGYVEFGYRTSWNDIEFYVTDTGIGIPEYEHEKIFQRFYQSEYSLSRRYEGLGLGLTISKAYAELMNGRIKLDSAPDKGSVFYVTVPVKFKMYGMIKPVSAEEKEEKTSTKKTIMIVEDDKNSLIYIERVLLKNDFNVICVSNGKEAVETCRSDKQIDLVLMDLKLPEMDGFEATLQIKKLRPELIVIAQTAYSTQEINEKIIQYGCNEVLYKPFNINELMEVINKFLSP